MPLPNFDESDKIFARAWLQKLQNYISLHPMNEEEGINTETMYLYGITYDWWHNGVTTLGHREIKTFKDFSQRLLDVFEHKNIKEYFKELAMLQHTTTMGAYIKEFQRIAISIPNIEYGGLAYLFMDGLQEPITSSVKAT